MILVIGCGKSPTSIQESDEKGIESDVNIIIADGPTCVDADGNVYKVVKIGDQWWMAENLKVKYYLNGESIDYVSDKNKWKTTTSAAYCYYDNDKNNGEEYGLLYNWRAATDKRGVAPKGWRVPTDSDFKILENYLGGRGKAGGKLKEVGTEHWAYPNNASNLSGFTALPGGQRDSRGDFSGMPGGFGFLWTATIAPNMGAWNRYLDHMYVELERGDFQKRCGFSIRCILKTDNIRVVRTD